jgi:hypothetical protein
MECQVPYNKQLQRTGISFMHTRRAGQSSRGRSTAALAD